jgi:cytoskeletal protein CcmA (bactofilin family)
VTLQSTSHVEGDLVHKSLAMEQGAYFDGKSSCSDDPLPASKTAAVEVPSAKPPPTTERRELRSDESTKAFIRSLPESRKA